MTAHLDLARRRCAAVTIDLHRGHLDPAVATMPLPADVAAEVTAANARFLSAVRAAGVPVIHVVTKYRNREEVATNPWWSTVAGTEATRANVLNHQLPGSPGRQLMSPVYDAEHDLVVDTKKRYDGFIHTDLEHALRSLRIDTLLLTGVNTNSCVLATVVAANARDFAAVVVSDCAATMDPDLHLKALDLMSRAFGWVMTSDEVLQGLATVDP